jgi:hypothetical protein
MYKTIENDPAFMNHNETPIARVRNLLSPVVNYFTMVRMIKERRDSEEYPDARTTQQLERLLAQELENCHAVIEQLLPIIKNDKNWDNMSSRIFKTITHVFFQDGSNVTKVIGIYAPDKINGGLEEAKKLMVADGKILIKEDKDCCNSFLEYEGGDHIYTGDFILNELNF